jgi:hypothetical protein
MSKVFIFKKRKQLKPEVDTEDENNLYPQTDEEWAEAYSAIEPQIYTNGDNCYRCNKPILEEDFYWYINKQAGYGSLIDSDIVNIVICDECLIEFLKQKNKTNKI